MSTPYVLKLAIDDSKIKEIEKRLMNIVGGGQGQQGGLADAVKSASTGGSLGKNIAKLAAIAIGVGALVGLVTKIASMSISASPMLAQMLKLMNFGVLLILRPIGDFFGFFLRPLIIYFLRSIILPWYRLARPLMQKFGQWLGMGVTQNVGSNLSGTWALITGDWESVSRITAESNARIQAFWENVVTDVGAWITSLNLPSFSNLSNSISLWITEQTDKLPAFWVYMKVAVRGWILNNIPQLPSWEAITIGINKWIEDNIGLLPTWDDVTSAVKGIHNAILGIAEAIKQFFIDLAAKFGIDISGLISTPTASATSAPAPFFDVPTESDIYPWLTETPSSNLSDSTKGHGR